jgi:hypothetical protein
MVSRNILGDIVLFVCAEFFGLFLSVFATKKRIRDQEAYSRPRSVFATKKHLCDQEVYSRPIKALVA